MVSISSLNSVMVVLNSENVDVLMFGLYWLRKIMMLKFVVSILEM